MKRCTVSTIRIIREDFASPFVNPGTDNGVVSSIFAQMGNWYSGIDASVKQPRECLRFPHCGKCNYNISDTSVCYFSSRNKCRDTLILVPFPDRSLLISLYNNMFNIINFKLIYFLLEIRGRFRFFGSVFILIGIFVYFLQVKYISLNILKKGLQRL